MAKYSPYHVFCDQVSSDTTLYDNFPNQFIWKSVDDLKTKGFVIDSVILGGLDLKEILMFIM
ncbi:MAG: hypothetical protein ACJ72S_18480 [Nitrososphaeraceae archaeon]